MSLRSAVRIAVRPRAVPAARAVVPRRSASSSSGHAKGGSSNATWAMGSAAIFGSLAAFILMPSSQKDHVAEGHHPHQPKEPGEPKHTKQELEDNVKNAPVESLAKKTGGDYTYDQVDAAKKEGRETTNPPKAVAQGDKKAPGEDENKGGNDDGSSSDEGAGGYQPSQQEITDSIKQAEKSNAPLVAEAAEEKQ